MNLGEPQKSFFANESTNGSPCQISYSFYIEPQRSEGLKIILVFDTSKVFYIGAVYHEVINRILEKYCIGVFFYDIKIFKISRKHDGGWDACAYSLIPNLKYYAKYQKPRSLLQKVFNKHDDPDLIKLQPFEKIIGNVQALIELDEKFQFDESKVKSIVENAGFRYE